MRQAHNIAKKMLVGRALQYMMRSIRDCRVTDLACGRGGDLAKVCQCIEYTGVDIAGGALAELRRRATELGVPVVHLYQCDATQLPELSKTQHLVLPSMHGRQSRRPQLRDAQRPLA